MDKNNILPFNQIQILILGDISVGKTSLVKRFLEDVFTTERSHTIGIDFSTKDIEIPEYKETVKVKFWDTSGQESFQSITSAFYKQVDGIVILFDITNNDSFLNVDHWIQRVSDNAKEGVLFYIVGNKSDCEEERKISKKDIENLVNKHKCKYFEISAKMNKNISLMILSMIKDYKEYTLKKKLKQKISLCKKFRKSICC